MALAAGTRLGPYEIHAPIGAGGMGEIYRGRDTRLGRDVAVKVLPDELARSGTALSRFEGEARAVAALSHPNILAIHDVGKDSGVRYAVTELLNGETLKARIERGPVPPRKAVDWALQAARGLAAAHERQIVHRDIKPENLFLTQDGLLKILDFGLAKQRIVPRGGGNDTPTMPATTEPGFVVGTAAYMSPEQVRSLPVDGRSDIFSLGAVLFEMLTGRRPFEGPSAAETMAAIARDEPPEIGDLAPSVPEGLARIVRHCLAKNPEARFHTARDLAFALEALSGGLEARSAPTAAMPAPGPVAPPRARPRWRKGAPAALVLLATAAAGWWARGPLGGGGKGPVPLSFVQLTDFPGVERQPALSPDARSVVYVSRSRGNDDLYLLRVGGRKPLNLTEDSGADDNAPAFSRDGAHLAFRSERSGGGVFVMEATGESVRRVCDFGYDPAWSPDGKAIAIATEAVKDPMSRATTSELWVVPSVGGSPRKLFDGDAVGPRWSPHGKRIAFWGSRHPTRNRDVFTVDAEGRGAPIALTEDAHVDWCPTWSPDGRFLYFGSSRGGTMNLWRVRVDESSGKRLGPPVAVTTPTAWSGWFGFSADGGTLVFADLDERANVWRARFDPDAEAVLAPHEAILRGRAIVSIDFSPAGDALAFSQRVLTWEAVGVVNAAGGGYLNLTGSAFYHRVPRWSPDGLRIVFYSNRDGHVQLFTVRPDGSGLAPLGAASGERLYPVFSPDGSRLLAATFGGGLAFLDPGKGDEARLVSEALPGVVFLPMSWSADGKKVAGTARPSRSVSHGAAGGPARGAFAFLLPEGPLQELDGAGTSPEWLPDSRRVLFVRDGGIVLLDTETGRRRVVLKEAGLPGSWGREIALSRDGRTLAWIESLGEGDVWLATMGKEGR